MAKAKSKAAPLPVAERDVRTVTPASDTPTKGAIEVKNVTAFSVTGNGNQLHSVALDGEKRIENTVQKKPDQKFAVTVDVV